MPIYFKFQNGRYLDISPGIIVDHRILTPKPIIASEFIPQNTLCTFIMINHDEEIIKKSAKGKDMYPVHYLQMNLTSKSMGKTVVDYIPPSPGVLMKRYAVLLFKQPHELDFSGMENLMCAENDHKYYLEISQFIHTGCLSLIAANYFIAKNEPNFRIRVIRDYKFNAIAPTPVYIDGKRVAKAPFSVEDKVKELESVESAAAAASAVSSPMVYQKRRKTSTDNERSSLRHCVKNICNIRKTGTQAKLYLMNTNNSVLKRKFQDTNLDTTLNTLHEEDEGADDKDEDKIRLVADEK